MAAQDLLNAKVNGAITEEGVKSNVTAALAYTTGWVGGNGCIPLNFLMEDAATAEIARVQLWQWAHHGARLDSGEVITPEYLDSVIEAVAPTITKLVAGSKDEHLKITKNYLKTQVRKQWPSEFLTSDLMPYLEAADGVQTKWQRSAL